MTRLFFSTIAALLFFPLGAQQKFEGYYSKAENRFVSRSSDGGYRFETFGESGHAPVQHRGLYGLIDTSGNVLVPIAYDRLDRFGRNTGDYLFYKEDSIGLVRIREGELLKLESGWIKSPCKNSKEECFTRESETGTFIAAAGEPGWAIVKSGNRSGLFSLARKRYVIPIQYDCETAAEWPCELCRDGRRDILVGHHYAVCREKNSFFVYDLRSEEKFGPFKKAVVLRADRFYLELPDGSKMLSASLSKPANVHDYEVLELFKERLIVRKEKSVGVIDADANVIVPLSYEDVYFHNSADYWVKKDGRWAMLDNEGKLTTGFEFYNIERLNAIFFTNLLYATKLDTAGNNLYKVSSPKGFSDHTRELKTLARAVLQHRDRRILFSALYARDDRSFAEKADGFHLITSVSSVSPAAWTNIYVLPVSIDFLAFQKGNRYGLEEKKVIYDGILFDAMDITNGLSRALYVENGTLYSRRRAYYNAPMRPNNDSKIRYYWEKDGKYEEYSNR